MGAKSESGSRLSSLCCALHEGERCQDFFARFTFAQRTRTARRDASLRSWGDMFFARCCPPDFAIFLRLAGLRAAARATPPFFPAS